MRLITNFIYLSGAEVASKVVTFAAITYLARLAGPVGLGYVEFAGAVLLCAGLIVDQGFGPYGAREIAKAPQRTAGLVSEIITARFVLAIVAYAAVIAFALSLGRPAIVTQLLVIYGLSLLAAPLLLQWVFQGHNMMRTVAAIQLIRQTVFAAVVFILVREESQIWIAALAEVCGVCGAAAYGVWMYRDRLGGTIRPGLIVSQRLFREGVPIGLSQMFWMLRMFGATVIIGIIASPEDTGFFGGAMRILVALHAFVWLYFFNLLPSLSQAWQRNDNTLATLTEKSLRGIAWTGAVGGLVWVLAAPTVVTGPYGPQFAPAGATLQWLGGVCVIAALSGHYRYALIAAGQQTAEMGISAVGAVFAIALILFGYANAGLSGAALGLLAAEIVVWWSAWWYASVRLGLGGHARLLMRPLAATALALAFALALEGLSPASSVGAQIVIVVAAASTQVLVLEGTARDRVRRLAVEWRPWLQGKLDTIAHGVGR